MSGLRGFGAVYAAGRVRSWYAKADGIKRWADDDTPVDATAVAHLTRPDDEQIPGRDDLEKSDE